MEKCQYHYFIVISLNEYYYHIPTFAYVKLKVNGSSCHMFVKYGTIITWGLVWLKQIVVDMV